jgi:hypothetical protein
LTTAPEDAEEEDVEEEDGAELPGLVTEDFALELQPAASPAAAATPMTIPTTRFMTGFFH